MTKKHIFIVGAGRSGTTFLWRILNNSPEVHLSTEIHYFSSLYHNGFLKNYKKFISKKKNNNIKNLLYCLTNLNNFGMYWEKNSGFNFKEVDAYFSIHKINFRNIYEFLLEHDFRLNRNKKKNIRYIGEKTPLNIFHLATLSKWYPDAIIMFIYRLPINVLNSEANKNLKPDYPFKKSSRLYYLGIIIFVFFEWSIASFIALYYKKIIKKNIIIVSYESLNLNKREIISLLCKNLKIQFDETLYDVPKSGSSFKNGSNVNYYIIPQYVKVCFKVLDIIVKILKINSIGTHNKHVYPSREMLL